MPTDWAAIRAEFPALENWIFLNTATFGQLPRRAVDAMSRHLAHRDELACADFLKWFDDADRIRGTIAGLIHCAPEDVGFIGNASVALALLLNRIEWQPGDRFLTLEGEFPNQLYAPALVEKRGVQVVQAADWNQFLKELERPVKLVALSTVNYTNGFRVPLDGLADRVHAAGGLLYLDGTQSLGALRFDAATAKPDVFAVHGYKWLLSPTGAGFVYVAPQVRPGLAPDVIGWRSHWDWRNVDHLHHGTPEFPAAAEKYEGGMLPFPLLYAMEASVAMMLELGPEKIEQRVLELAEYLRDRLRKIGAKLLYDSSPHFESPIVAARFEGRDSSALAKQLYQRGVVVSARHGNLRVSVHLYNTEQDIDRLASVLEELFEG